MKNHHISEAGVSFEIQFGLCIKIWAGEHIFFYIWQQTIALITCNTAFYAIMKFRDVTYLHDRSTFNNIGNSSGRLRILF